ncbi:MAG: DoxX family protein [Bacteroidales bacterium]|nr:DoxX family protein [Bacteroidales bacterium]
MMNSKVNQLFNMLVSTSGDNRSLIPRIIVGLVFLSEGLQKYIIPEVTGTGRFENIGFDNAEFLAYFVATFEIISGILLLAGFMTRLSAFPPLIIMITAIITTKIPMLADNGFWAMAHAARTDFAMTMLLIYLIVYGGGKGSVDRLFFQIKSRS